MDHAVDYLAFKAVRGLVGRGAERIASFDIETGSMPRTLDATIFDRAAIEFRIIVGAPVLEGIEVSIEVKDQKRDIIHFNALIVAISNVCRRSNVMPLSHLKHTCC